MRSPTKVVGFSTKRSICPPSRDTTTPYLLGSSTLVTAIVPSRPWLRWNSSIAAKGKLQITSELSTKNGSPSRSSDSASLRGPAVPSGYGSSDVEIRMPSLASYSASASIIFSGW
eukprot:Amastigsp_a842049_99.p3 type:complete len:115 gc:universal Amastigsp_a842049_99:641-985(+)